MTSMTYVLPALVAFLVIAPPGHATETVDPLEKTLLAETQAWVDAIPKGDKATWEKLLTDDAVLVDEFGRVNHKTDSIASLQPFPAGLSGSIELRNPSVTRHGDTALLQVEEYERETVFGQSLVVRYQSLLTFVREKGMWKLAGYADVTIPTEPPALKVTGLVDTDYVGTYRYSPGRAWKVLMQGGELQLEVTKGAASKLSPLARDVFMGSDDEKNLYLFQRDEHGKVIAVIERRKFNDLTLTRDP